MGLDIPREISDSITNILGEGARINLRRYVRVEIRPDKLEQKPFVLSDHRIFIFSNKSASRCELSIHFLELKGIQSSDNKITFITDARKLKVFLQDAKDVDDIVHQIADSLLEIFPHLALENLVGKLDISPPERLKRLLGQMKDKKKRREIGPCGNFSAQYRCMCDLHNQPYMEEIAWDVDTIYLALNSKWLMLADFDHLDGKHLVPLIATMAYNNWFTVLCACDVKLVPEALQEYTSVIRSNTSIEHYCIINGGHRGEFVHKMASHLAENVEHTSISHIYLSGNQIEDRGLTALCPVLSSLPKGIVDLKLSRCGLTQKSVNRLAEALINNTFVLSSLKVLDLSENNFKEDITKGKTLKNLCNFLATPNALTTLNLSATDCALDNIFGALIRGCCKDLVHLNLSGNAFSAVKAKAKHAMVPVSWKQFFASALSLKTVNLADNKLPLEAIKNMMLGLSSNENLNDVSLNLSNNGLGVQGGGVVETCIAENTNITALDISDNNLEGYLAKMLETLSQVSTLKKLAIGKNFSTLRPKQLPVILEAVVNIMQEEDSALESLSLADSKLKQDTAVIINALGGNANLTELDISGNLMGDMGARLLMKALCINNKLRTIHWDGNNTLPQGFADLATALTKNFTVQSMPIPVQDLVIALRANREKTEKAIHSIEKSLQRNNSPRKFGSEQAYRLQQSFLMSSTQELVDRYMVELLESVGTLEKRGEDMTELEKQDVAKARALMQDAENSRQLLLQLQKISSKCEAEGSDVHRKMHYMTDDLQATLEKYLKESVGEMIKVAQGRCVTLMDSDLSDSMRQECLLKAKLPNDFGKEVLFDQAGPDVYNKLNEVNLNIAFHISEKLFEALLDSLDKVQKNLTEHIRKGESELDKLARESIRRSNKKEQEPSGADSLKSRKSILSKRLSVRPQSQVSPSELSPVASGIITESDDESLDSYVFVDADDQSDESNKTTNQSSAVAPPTTVTSSVAPPESPVTSTTVAPTTVVTSFTLHSDSIKEPKSPPPQKPPPPKVVKAHNAQGGTKYVHQGKDVKPSPGKTDRTNKEESGPEPHVPPRRKHVKKDSDSSLGRYSALSGDSSSHKIEASPQLTPPAHLAKTARSKTPELYPDLTKEAPVSKTPELYPSLTKEAPVSTHKIEISPQLTPPTHAAKPIDKRHPPERPTERPHAPERPPSFFEKPATPEKLNDKPGERASTLILGRSGVPPPRPPPAKPNRISIHTGSLERNTPERPTPGSGQQHDHKPPVIPQRPGEKPLINRSSTPEKPPAIPERPGEKHTPDRSSSGSEKPPVIPERPPAKPARLSAAERLGVIKPSLPAQSPPASQSEKTASPMGQPTVSKTLPPQDSGKNVAKTEETKAESSEMKPKVTAVMITTEEASDDESEVKDGKDEVTEDEDRNESDQSVDVSDSMSTSVDSLLEDSRESTPNSEDKTSSLIKPSSSSGSKKKKDSKKVKEFDSLMPLPESAPLTHLTKARPKRATTSKPSRAGIKSEAYVIEDIGGAGMDDFFDTKPVSRNVVSRENSSNDLKKVPETHTETNQEEKTAGKKKGMMPLFKGIDFSKPFKLKSSPKSPVEKTKSPEEPKKAREETPAEPAHRKSPAKELEEEKVEAKPEVKPVSRRPPGAVGMPGMGMGGLGGSSLLAEMKLKRTSMMPGNKDKANEPKDRNSGEKDGSPQRNSGGARPFSLFKAGERKSGEDNDKPTPPTKPKPALKPAKPATVPPPKPGGPSPRPNSHTKAPAPPVPSGTHTRGSAEGEDTPRTSSDSEDKAPPTAAVRRRSSIKDRIALLDRNSNETSSPVPAPRPSALLRSKEQSRITKDPITGRVGLKEARPVSLDCSEMAATRKRARAQPLNSQSSLDAGSGEEGGAGRPQSMHSARLGQQLLQRDNNNKASTKSAPAATAIAENGSEEKKAPTDKEAKTANKQFEVYL